MVEGATSFEWLRWIPLLPLLGAAIQAVFLVVLRREASHGLVIAVSVGAPVLAFAITCAAFVKLVSLPADGLLVDEFYSWVGSGRLSVNMAFHFDALAAVLTGVVTGVGSLIHVYSIGYMLDDHRDDGGFQRFFCYLNLFMCSMLLLVLGDNLLVMFLGWEGVGLCSYLLIGFWYGDRHNAYCGMKAFVVNRIGDAGFLIGLFLILKGLSDAGLGLSFDFRVLQESIDALAQQSVTVPPWFPGAPEWKLTTLIGLSLFLGACGKSAQIPLYTWLPDAMAGPTPVSALIHAATMVTAGVYMICRMSFLYAEAPGALAVVAWTGGLTALFAATMAITQTDIKKVLAYSTVSQLGYMFLAAGCGSYAAAMFHVFTHAFFKALLFLGAGAVIMALHHEQDTEKMGGLRRRLPHTHLVFLIAVLAISGFPPLSGFFSKDETLLAAWTNHGVPGHRWLWAIGVFTTALTAFYMFRLHFRTFAGSYRGPEELRDRIEEPAPVVLQPLYVLAFLTAVGGFVGLPQVYGDWFGIPDSNSFSHFLASVVPVPHHEVTHATELGLAGLAIVFAGLGACGAWWLYVRSPQLPVRIARTAGAAYRLVRDKYYVDEVYDALIVRPLVTVSDRVLFRVVDAGIIDGVGVNGTASAVRVAASRGLKYIQSGFTQAYLFLMVLGTLAVVVWMLRRMT